MVIAAFLVYLAAAIILRRDPVLLVIAIVSGIITMLSLVFLIGLVDFQSGLFSLIGYFPL